MIRLERVSKSYAVPGGRHVILDDVSFELPPLSRVGIFGVNVRGQVRPAAPDRGQRDARPRPHRARGAHFVPVGFTGTFHPHLSPARTWPSSPRVYGMNHDEVSAWIEEFAELDRYFDMPVGTYSSGMFARIAVATSFAFDFDLYLVDEVIEVGDASFRRKCAPPPSGSGMHSASLILVSQHVETIRQYCNLGAVLHRGKLSDFTTIDEALETYERSLRAT